MQGVVQLESLFGAEQRSADGGFEISKRVADFAVDEANADSVVRTVGERSIDAGASRDLNVFAADIARTMKDAGVIARLGNAGTEAVGSTAQELDTFNRDQLALYRRIVQDPKLQLNLQ